MKSILYVREPHTPHTHCHHHVTGGRSIIFVWFPECPIPEFYLGAYQPDPNDPSRCDHAIGQVAEKLMQEMVEALEAADQQVMPPRSALDELMYAGIKQVMESLNIRQVKGGGELTGV